MVTPSMDLKRFNPLKETVKTVSRNSSVGRRRQVSPIGPSLVDNWGRIRRMSADMAVSPALFIPLL